MRTGILPLATSYAFVTYEANADVGASFVADTGGDRSHTAVGQLDCSPPADVESTRD